MGIIKKLKKLVANSVKFTSNQTIGNICVNAVLARDPQAVCDLQKCNDPCRYFSFLSECIGPLCYRVDIVKKLQGSSNNTSVDIFNLILTSLINNPQVIPYRIARTIGLAADRYFGNFQAKGNNDIAHHFKISSSFSSKGRLLSTILRYTKPIQSIELGTAYGMSGMFILSMLQWLGRGGVLDTIEGTQAQYDLSSQLLREYFGDRVKCHLGAVQKVLPEILDTIDSIDFVFHDAGHSYKSYTEDFLLIESKLSEGAVVLFDDIRWSTNVSGSQDPQTYRGWQKVISHPRVIMAVEINRSQGLLLAGPV